MPLRSSGKIFVLALEPPFELPIGPSPAEHIVASLAPGATASRYRREWIIGRTEVDDGVLSGRIGFRGADGVAELYDEGAKDFKEVAVPAGLTAPFAVDLEGLRLAVQPRGGAIKLNGLKGAFRELLSAGGNPWRVYIPGHDISYAAWRKTVSRVTDVKLRLRKPNPHYRDTPDLEALLEQAEAKAARLDLRSDEGLDTEAPFIKQSMEHIEAGYGRATMVGVRDEVSGPRETVYTSTVGSAEAAFELPVSQHGEVDRAELARALMATETAGAPSDSEQHGEHPGAN